MADALNHIKLTETERVFAPAWAFNVVGSGIFRSILSTTSFGAFEAAHAAVRRIPGCRSFTMKELICSPDVADKFAFLVAYEYLGSGDELSQSSRGSRYSRNSTYLNVHRLRQLLGQQVYTCKIWFESVRARSNPLLLEFDAQKQRRLDEYAEEIRRKGTDNLLDLIEADFRENFSQERVNDLIGELGILGYGNLTQPLQNAMEQNLVPNPSNQDRKYLVDLYVDGWNTLIRRIPGIEEDRINFFKQKMDIKLEQYRKLLPERELVYRPAF